MASPTLNWYINTGTEGSPVWGTEITGSKVIYFAGPDTTASVLDPVTAPASSTKFPEEMWVGDSPFASGVQASLYEQDISAATNTNVFAITFSTNPTSTAPVLTAWDTSAHATTAKELLAGTTLVAECLLRGHITSSNVATGAGAGSIAAGWKTQITTTDTYKLEGDTFFQTASSAIDAGNQLRFLLSAFVPSDITAGTTGHDPVITCRFTFV